LAVPARACALRMRSQLPVREFPLPFEE